MQRSWYYMIQGISRGPSLFRLNFLLLAVVTPRSEGEKMKSSKEIIIIIISSYISYNKKTSSRIFIGEVIDNESIEITARCVVYCSCGVQ